jgi:hypothetical protein
MTLWHLSHYLQRKISIFPGSKSFRETGRGKRAEIPGKSRESRESRHLSREIGNFRWFPGNSREQTPLQRIQQTLAFPNPRWTLFKRLPHNADAIWWTVLSYRHALHPSNLLVKRSITALSDDFLELTHERSKLARFVLCDNPGFVVMPCTRWSQPMPIPVIFLTETSPLSVS